VASSSSAAASAGVQRRSSEHGRARKQGRGGNVGRPRSGAGEAGAHAAGAGRARGRLGTTDMAVGWARRQGRCLTAATASALEREATGRNGRGQEEVQEWCELTAKLVGVSWEPEAVGVARIDGEGGGRGGGDRWWCRPGAFPVRFPSTEMLSASWRGSRASGGNEGRSLDTGTTAAHRARWPDRSRVCERDRAARGGKLVEARVGYGSREVAGST
jgi:hypothetical protein